MGKMKKRLLSVFFLGTLLLFTMFYLERWNPHFFSSDQSAQSDTQNSEIVLHVPFIFYTAIPEDFEKVNEAFDSLVNEKLGFHVNLIAISSSARAATVTMMKNEGILFDIFSNLLGTPFTQNENLLPLDELLQTDGQGILKVLSEEELCDGRVNGQILKLSNKGDIAECSCVVVRKDLLEKYHITEKASSLKELNEILTDLNMEEDIALIAPSRLSRSFLNRYATWLEVADAGLVIMDYGEAPTIELLYETEEYQTMVSLFYEWKQKGWMPDAAMLHDFPSSDLVKNEELFGYFCHYKPGIDTQESMKCGYEMEAWILTEPFLDSSVSSSFTYSISKQCKNPKWAMQLLNFMYTSKEAMNLLNYGIEGENYRINDVGNAVPIVGQEEKIYYSSLGWELPNQYLCSPWGTDKPTIWEEIQLFNEKAKKPSTLGFKFDVSLCQREISDMLEVIEEYALGLETGNLDPEKYLPEFLQALKKAGSEQVKEEANKQFFKWKHTSFSEKETLTADSAAEILTMEENIEETGSQLPTT